MPAGGDMRVQSGHIVSTKYQREAMVDFSVCQSSAFG